MDKRFHPVSIFEESEFNGFERIASVEAGIRARRVSLSNTVALHAVAHHTDGTDRGVQSLPYG